MHTTPHSGPAWRLVVLLGRPDGRVNGNPLQYSCLVPWTEEPGRLQSMGSQEMDMTKRQTKPTRCAALSLLLNFSVPQTVLCKITLKIHCNKPKMLPIVRCAILWATKQEKKTRYNPVLSYCSNFWFFILWRIHLRSFKMQVFTMPLLYRHKKEK